MNKNYQAPTFSPYNENNDVPENNGILQPDKRTGMAEQYIDLSNQPVNTPSPTANVSGVIENGLSSPYFDKIRQNEQRRMVLNTMPIVDKNGRGRSGLRALIEGLSESFDPKFGIARNWTDFSARLARAGGKAVGGLVNPAWDEEADKQKEILKIDEENERLTQIGQRDWQMRNQVATQTLNQQKEVNKQNSEKGRQDLRVRDLDLREARQTFQKLNTEQKTTLSMIMKRGFYKEGVNKDEDAQIAKLGIVLPDFDSRKPITREQNGKFFQYDHDKEDWVEADGLPVDESETPIEYSVNGQRMKLRPRDIAGIESAKERQTVQINAQRTQQEDAQDFQMRMRGITDENQATSQITKAMEDGQKRIASGDLTKEQYDSGMMSLINMFNEPIRSKLMQKYKGGNK